MSATLPEGEDGRHVGDLMRIKMTNEEWRMRSAEGDAVLAAAANHCSRQNRYKEDRNSCLRRSSTVFGLLLNPLNLFIMVIPLQSAGAPEHYRLWVEPWGHTRKISHTREKRWSRNVTVGKLSSYSFGSLEKRVPVTSRRVPVSHLRVPVASECTPGASQRVPMGSELCVWARNPRANVTFSSEMQSWLSCRGNLWEMRYGS